MGFNLIERYIFKRGAVATLVTLICLTGVVWIVQALRQLDVITTKGAAILMYLQLTTFAVPLFILAIIPIGLLVGTIFTINTLNANTELVVINASGASNWILIKPMIILALLCSLFVGFVGHYMTAWSLTQLKNKAAEMQADLVSIVVREGTFNSIKDGLTFHIAKRDAAGLLRGIMISDERDKKNSSVYTAREGIVTRFNNTAVLLLKDGEIHQRNLEDGSVTVIKYQSYAFDLSSLSGKTVLPKTRPKERITSELLNPDPDDFYYKAQPGLYRQAIHERFSEMLWPFTYVVIILAFAGQARSNRQSYGAAIFWAVTMTITLRGFAFSGASSLKFDPNAVYVVYALPMSGILIGSWFLYKNTPVALPKPVYDALERQQLKLASKFEGWHASYLRFRRRMAEAKS